jgi:hypothetical protein
MPLNLIFLKFYFRISNKIINLKYLSKKYDYPKKIYDYLRVLIQKCKDNLSVCYHSFLIMIYILLNIQTLLSL